MLDAYAARRARSPRRPRCYTTLAAARERSEDSRSQRQVSDQEIELLRFQVEEIAAASLDRPRRRSWSSATVSRRTAAASPKTQIRPSICQCRLTRTSAMRSASSANWSDLIPPRRRVAGFDSARVEIEELRAVSGRTPRSSNRSVRAPPHRAAHRRDRDAEAEIRPDRRGRDRLRGPRAGSVSTVSTAARASCCGSPRRLRPPRRRWEGGKSSLREAQKGGSGSREEIASHLSDLGFNQSIFEIEIEPLPSPARAGSRALTFSLARTPANRSSRSASSPRAAKCRGSCSR